MNASVSRCNRTAGLLLFLVLGSAAGCLVPPVDRRHDPPAEVTAVKQKLLVPGEKLTYTIKAGIFTLGQAELSIKASEKGKHLLNLTLFANSTHPWLPSLSYTYTSLVKRTDWKTVSFNLEEMRKTEIVKTVRFIPDYKEHVGSYSIMKGKAVRKGKLPLKEAVYDYISVVYLLRTALPEIGKKIEVPLFHEGRLFQLKFKNITKRDIAIGGTGRFSAYILKPHRDLEGVFVRRGKVLIWIDATYRIPLKILITLPFGTCRIELKKAENTQTGDVFIP